MCCRRTVVGIGLVLASAGVSLGEDVPATRSGKHARDAEQVLVIQRMELEREVAGLPRASPKRVRDVVEFAVEEDFLTARTHLSPVDAEMRVISPNLPGVTRLRILDLPSPDDESIGRNFTYIQTEVPEADALRITHISAIAGRLNLARDAESKRSRQSVQLVQDPPGTPLEPDTEPVRLLIREHGDPDGPPDVDLTLGAPSFTELRRRHPREVETYLRPIFDDFQQAHAIFAIDPRVAWQVLGEGYQPDEEMTERVRGILADFDADDFRQRQAAQEKLRQLGQPAAIVLRQMDRGGLSPEQSTGVDTFLAEYEQLKGVEVERLRTDAAFLLDTLAVDDPQLRRLALEQLRKVAKQPIAFDPDADAQTRSNQLQQLRETLLRK